MNRLERNQSTPLNIDTRTEEPAIDQSTINRGELPPLRCQRLHVHFQVDVQRTLDYSCPFSIVHSGSARHLALWLRERKQLFSIVRNASVESAT